MLITLLAILIILWFLGYISIPGLIIPDIILFTLSGHPISLWDLLIFFVIVGVIGILPSPFRQIAAVLFILWLLAVLGILAISGLSSLFLAFIVGLIIYFLGL